MWLRRPRRRNRNRGPGAAGATTRTGARPCAPTIDGDFEFRPTVHFFDGLPGTVGVLKNLSGELARLSRGRPTYMISRKLLKNRVHPPPGLVKCVED